MIQVRSILRVAIIVLKMCAWRVAFGARWYVDESVSTSGDLAKGARDDPDDDGIGNGKEYLSGTDPIVVGDLHAVWCVDLSMTVSGDGISRETAFKAIQEGINASFQGDRVIVAPGTYVENIHIQRINIVLTSTDPLDRETVNNTIIDGSQSDSVVMFWGTEDETCILSGFTIRNGNAYSGGGIQGSAGAGDSTQATIRNNVITSNSAELGGGIYYCDGRIEGNTITANAAGRWGGGLSDCYGIVQNNLVVGNFSTVWAGGLAYCSGILRNNTIVYNPDGGLFNCRGTIQNCMIWANARSQVTGASLRAYCCI